MRVGPVYLLLTALSPVASTKLGYSNRLIFMEPTKEIFPNNLHTKDRLSWPVFSSFHELILWNQNDLPFREIQHHDGHKHVHISIQLLSSLIYHVVIILSWEDSTNGRSLKAFPGIIMLTVHWSLISSPVAATHAQKPPHLLSDFLISLSLVAVRCVITYLLSVRPFISPLFYLPRGVGKLRTWFLDCSTRTKALLFISASSALIQAVGSSPPSHEPLSISNALALIIT